MPFSTGICPHRRLELVIPNWKSVIHFVRFGFREILSKIRILYGQLDRLGKLLIKMNRFRKKIRHISIFAFLFFY